MWKYIFTVICVFFFSCKDKGVPEFSTPLIVDIYTSKNTDFFDLVQSAKFIELETTSKSLMGEVGRISIDKHIFISDQRMTELLKFDMEGQFLSKISSVGNGPGEYVSIGDFFYNPEDSSINILDISQKKVLAFSSQLDLIEEKTITLSVQPFNGAFLPGTDRIVYNKDIYESDDDKYRLFICDKDFNIISKLLPYEGGNDCLWVPRTRFYNIDDTLVYIPTYSNVVYNVFEDRVEERHTFNFLSEWLDEEFLMNSANVKSAIKFFEEIENGGLVYDLNTLETSSHILMIFRHIKTPYLYLYNKQNGNSKIIRDKSSDGFLSHINVLTIYDDQFVFSVSPDKVEDKIEGLIAEESNPVLMFVKFKDE